MKVNPTSLGTPCLGAIVCSMLIYMSGCASVASVPMYQGKRRTMAEVGRITPTDQAMFSSRLATHILAVDGEKLASDAIRKQASVDVLPGIHNVTVMAMLHRHKQRVPFEDPKPLEIAVKADEEYFVMSRSSEGRQANEIVVRFWVEDSSGNVVAGSP